MTDHRLTQDGPDDGVDKAWDAAMDEDWDLSLVAARWPEPLPWHELAGEVAW